MSKKGFENRNDIFRITETFKQKCLYDQQSIFGYDRLWSIENLEQLHKFYVENLDLGEGTFYVKLNEQLKNATENAKLLAAELIWLILLFPSNIGLNKKRDHISLVLSWAGKAIDTNNPAFSDSVLIGIGSGGPGINYHFWLEFKFAIILFKKFFNKSIDERKVLLLAPWDFAVWIDSIEESNGRQFRHMLLYLLFPENFERISSEGDKRAILNTFNTYLYGDLSKEKRIDVDKALFAIRQELIKEYKNDDLDFYTEPLVTKWSKKEMSIYNIIVKFLKQTKTSNLATREYPETINSYNLKVGFGKGNQAEIPWIAILCDNQEVMNGIYPLYLFYKNQDKLLLCFGISETNEPTDFWPADIIKDYQKVENVIKNPRRYGNSTVFKEYLISNATIHDTEDDINDDYNRIIESYKKTLLDIEIKEKPLIKNIPFSANELIKDLTAANLLFNIIMALRFVSCLAVKPFVILTGLSGSGKTKLAQSFATWISSNKNQYCIIPVGADWTNREPLLGYPNALEPGKYVKPDNGVLDLLINAEAKLDLPFFLILDEMNLSHVERYFTDFLSAMESGLPIPLHSNKSGMSALDGTAIPCEIKMPDNLFIIGTVNIDETTYMSSPKVLDRAGVVEFRISEDEISAFLKKPGKPAIDAIAGKGASMAHDFLQKSKIQEPEFDKNEKDEIAQVLQKFFLN
jgi:5-methylcytosine-specific restriction protein B